MGNGASMPPDASDAMSAGATPSPAKLAVSAGRRACRAGGRVAGGGRAVAGRWSWWDAQQKPHGREKSQGS